MKFFGNIFVRWIFMKIPLFFISLYNSGAAVPVIILRMEYRLCCVAAGDSIT